jgi:hypothetical protein
MSLISLLFYTIDDTFCLGIDSSSTDQYVPTVGGMQKFIAVLILFRAD